jgi:L-lactate dehydrogenase complex protein LldE
VVEGTQPALTSRPMRAALFVPCFVDHLAPQAAIAALHVLERLGVDVVVPAGAACCGQPLANAGFVGEGDDVLRRLAGELPAQLPVIVLSGSCALHLRAHGARAGSGGASLAGRAVEFCAFLHDVVGLDRVRRLGASCPARAALHVGCHALRGLGLGTPSERQVSAPGLVQALLATVGELELVTLARRDECCGFGGSFSVDEPHVSARMGRDRLLDMRSAGAQAIITTDLSCGLHLQGIDAAAGGAIPVWHVAEVLACATHPAAMPAGESA